MDIKPDRIPGASPSPSRGNAIPSELAHLRQTLGASVEARVLQVVAPSPASTTTATPTQQPVASASPSQPPPPGGNASAPPPPVGGTTVSTPPSPGSGATSRPAVIADGAALPAPPPTAQTGKAATWNITLAINGLAQPLQVEWQGDILPPGLQAGALARLDIVPSRGLALTTVLPPPPVPSLQASLLRTLAHWLPVQTDLSAALDALHRAPLDDLPDTLRGPLELARQATLPLSRIRDIGLLAARLAATGGSLERTLLNLAAPTGQSATQPAHDSAAGIGRGLLAAAANQPPGLPQAQPGTGQAPLTTSVQTLDRLLQSLFARAGSTAGGAPMSPPPGQVTTDAQVSRPAMQDNAKASVGVLEAALAGSARGRYAGASVDPTSGLSPPVTSVNTVSGLVRHGNDGSMTALMGASVPVGSPWPGAAEGHLKAALLLAATRLLATGSGHGSLPQSWPEALPWLTRQISGSDALRHPLRFPQGAEESRAAESRTSDPEGLLKVLLQLVSRLHVHQLNGLQQTLQQGAEPGQPQVWLAELPVQSDRLHNVQLRIERERHEPATQEKKPRYRWAVVLAFNFAETGQLQTRLHYFDGTVSATLWAERAPTLRLIHEHLPTLREGLRQWGLTVGGIEVRQGQPPLPQSPVSRQLIDERA